MIASINFADAKYRKQQRLNTKTAYLLGKVDKVYSFSPEDIDEIFYKQNKNILSQKRGAGLWLWKPYFILRVLNEINDGDALVYADSGIVYIRNVNSLIEKLKTSKQDIMLFELPLLECQWTKKSVLEALSAYTEKNRFSNQMIGTVFVIIKSSRSYEFVQKWLDLCMQEKLICSKEKDDNEDFMYIAHREDQSILSVLAKKNGIIPFSDPTDYGKFFNQYLTYNRLFYLPIKDKKYKIEKSYFILSRNSNFLKYYFVYLLKCTLNMFCLKKISL
jgi:hypothetical protein